MARLLLFFLLLLFSQCASYWKNRKKDLQDVVTLGVEKPMVGASIQVGPVPIGFLFQGGESEIGKRDQGEGFGNRGGDLGTYRSQQLVFFILGGSLFVSGKPLEDDKGNEMVDKQGIPLVGEERANLKSHKMRYLSFFSDPIKDRKARKKETFKRELMKDLIEKSGKEEALAYLPETNTKPKGYPKGFLWNLEIVAGIYGGIRAGLNLAELADFATGIVGYDLLEDDVETKSP